MQQKNRMQGVRNQKWGSHNFGGGKKKQKQTNNVTAFPEMCSQNKNFPHSAYTHFSRCLPVMC